MARSKPSQSFDERMALDKAKRKELFKAFKDIGEQLRRIGPDSDHELVKKLIAIRASRNAVDPPDHPPETDRPRVCGRSFITQEDHQPC